MASEKTILRALDLLTLTPQAEVESLDRSTRGHVRSMRRVVDTKNVVALGISEKVSKGVPTGELALTFYVERKVPLETLRADRAVPPALPETVGGSEAVPTDVIAIGRLVPEVNATRSPLQPGNSIGHVEITAGTFGALVTKGKSLHILSNSHVLALSGLAKKGDKIIYPGDADGGTEPEDLVAKLSGFEKFIPGGDFVNRVDCAIAKPVAAKRKDLTSFIREIGIPRGTIKPKRGMEVVKVGRTTGKTFGEIRDVNFRFVLNYEGVGPVGFIDQVLCTRYTQGGDSGSLVVDRATGRAVGLHFAGASGGSVFCPIDNVLEALGVKLVTKAISLPEKAASKRKKRTKKTTKKRR
jgi:hypothetical protein